LSRKILVTGGCGYIGSVLVPMLLEQGYAVRVFDKLYFGEEPLKAVLDKIEMVPGDVRDFDEKVLDGIDAVVHLGSLSNYPTAAFDPEANYSINCEGTVKLAAACKKRGVQRLTFASGCAVYGFYVDGIVDESSATNPQGDYDKSKLDAEVALREMADDSFCPVILRQGTVFGLSSRMRWDLVVNAFVMNAFKNGRLDVWYGGEAWRPLVHTRDVAQAHIRCLEAAPDKVRGEVFHVVHKNYRILELAQRVRRVLAQLGIRVEIDVNYDEVDKRSYRVSNQKLAKVLGFTPKISVEEGVREIVAAIQRGQYTDFDHPVYYNLPWLMLLVEIEKRIKKTGKVL